MTTTLQNTTIHRHRLYVTDIQVLSVPSSHTVLSVAPGRQQGRGVYELDMWIRVSPSHHDVDLAVYTLGTGNPWPTYSTNGGDNVDINLNPVGTCVMDDGLVWHVFIGPVPQ